jgi:hypothetical protein
VADRRAIAQQVAPCGPGGTRGAAPAQPRRHFAAIGAWIMQQAARPGSRCCRRAATSASQATCGRVQHVHAVGDWSHTSGTAWTYGATSAPAVSANGVGTRRAVGGAGINATADAHHGRNGSGWRRSARSACAGLNRWAASRRGAAGGTGGAHLSCLRRLRLALGLGTFSHTRDTDLAARACGWQLGSEGTFPASQTESRLHTRPAGRARHAGPVPHMSGRSGEVNPITCYTLLARCISA